MYNQPYAPILCMQDQGVSLRMKYGYKRVKASKILYML